LKMYQKAIRYNFLLPQHLAAGRIDAAAAVWMHTNCQVRFCCIISFSSLKKASTS
jgi:hypothetical protein